MSLYNKVRKSQNNSIGSQDHGTAINRNSLYGGTRRQFYASHNSMEVLRNDIDRQADPGSRPLENIRHERFAVLYSGECFGNASKAYQGAGYRPKTHKTAGNEGSRLLENVGILARVRYLRKQHQSLLAIDCTRILELRLQVVYDRDAPTGDRLAALRDVEKSLGLDRPQKVDIQSHGSVLVIT